MRKILSFFILFIAIYSHQTKLIAYSSDPKLFISELVEDALTTLSNKNIDIKDKHIKIEEIATENVDIRALGLYTLGEKRKSLACRKIQMGWKKQFKQVFDRNRTSKSGT